MKELGRSPFRRFLNSRLVPVVLASGYLLSVPFGFAGLCFYNWAAEWWAGVTLLVASLGLLLGRWWSNLVAIAASAPVIYRFCYAALKVHRVLPLRPDEEAEWLAPDVWWGFILRSPESYIPLALATFILIYAGVRLGMQVSGRRFMLP